MNIKNIKEAINKRGGKDILVQREIIDFLINEVEKNQENTHVGLCKVFCLNCQFVYIENNLVLYDDEPPNCRYCEGLVSLVKVEEGEESDF